MMTTKPSIGNNGEESPVLRLRFELAHWTVYECVIAVIGKALAEEAKSKRDGAAWWADKLTRLCCEAPEKAKTITMEEEETDYDA